MAARLGRDPGRESVQLPYVNGPNAIEELERGVTGTWKRDATPQDVLTQWRKIVGRDPYEDMIRVIREKRPDLLLTWEKTQGWTGHIEHRMVAELAERAFNDAINPEIFPQQLREGLRPWQPKWLFWVLRARATGSAAERRVRAEPDGDGRLDGFGRGGRTAADVKAAVVMSYQAPHHAYRNAAATGSNRAAGCQRVQKPTRTRAACAGSGERLEINSRFVVRSCLAEGTRHQLPGRSQLQTVAKL